MMLSNVEFINYVLNNNSSYPYDRFYIKESKNEVSIHDNYDYPESCGLIKQGQNYTVRSYNMMQDISITEDQMKIIAKDMFYSGADYAVSLILEYNANREKEK